ncbi:MAG: hypothetical protein ACJ8FS_12020 [Sphingomicrobium sp.]
MESTLLSLVVEDSAGASRRVRLLLFIVWLSLVLWFCTTHTFWRDEVRAFSLALSGSNYAEMLRTVHGEGHPALWYLILRGAHDIFPYREVLPIAGAVIGIAAMAIFTFASPFRTLIIGLVLFSFWAAFEYVAIARNYGISALVMFSIAALYCRIRGTLWFGVMIALLCNTNVPSCILAAAFMLFRFVEMLAANERPTRRDWAVYAGNAALAALGAYLCFRTVYPTFNDAAVSSDLGHLSAITLGKAFADPEWGFSHIGFDSWQGIPINFILLGLSCLGLIRRPGAIVAALAGLLALKLFFYLVYVSYYRHEILYLVFLLSLYWMEAAGAGGSWSKESSFRTIRQVGITCFIVLLMLQSVRLLAVVRAEITGAPFSRIADVAQLLKRPELSGAIVMGDPDTMLEALPYYANNPIWFLRQQHFGHVVRFSNNARINLSLTDILADAERLHAATGRPIVILSHLQLQTQHYSSTRVMFRDATVMRPAEVAKFLASTRHLASLRPSESDEDYDVYVYPR